MNRLSLRLRLTLAGAGAVTLAIALASLGLAALFAAHVERRAVAELSVQLDQVLAGIERDAAGALDLATAPADPRFQHPYGGLYWQLDAAGERLRSRSLWDYDLPLPPDLLHDGAAHVHRLPGPEGGELLAVERSVTLPARLGAVTLRAAVAMDRAELAEARTAFLRDLAPYSAVLALALMAAGWAQIAVGLRPLHAIRDRVTAVRTGRAARLGEEFPAEVRPLAAEVDALLAAREAELARARTRAGDLAHGLKTPLQALMGEAGRLRAGGRTEAADAIEEIAGAMRAHVERELARSRVAMQGRAARADVGQVVAGLIRVIGRTRAGAALDWRQEVPEGLIAAADPDDLAEALGALIENAAHFADARVTVAARRAGARVEIAIRDDGPGIAPDRIDALMARGARADTSGSGLGLAIARDIAEALDGSLTLHPADPGLEARLSVPRAEDPAL
ncbi:sensor histidine kinase [Rhodovulum strictum]|uniref:histidine kinase n=1 Tax=Rhodovulum strictum TaxID=58314 RepID=A0A844B7P6_9RHOB|nr:HAMP domain-containing sensor histidine kinase [Rhodovulum strictum]MRH22291.1 sensor histidine kinase [Rhodovulum strictum]